VKACSPTAEAYRQRDARSESVGGCRPETLVGPRVYAFFRRRGEHGLTAEFHDLLRVILLLESADEVAAVGEMPERGGLGDAEP
jgi:hypothetical protein